MPRGDGTGPNGAGPGTGRKMGYCSGNSKPGFRTASGKRQGSSGGGLINNLFQRGRRLGRKFSSGQRNR